MKRCRHGRSLLFCCSCNYGEHSWYKEREYTNDLVDDLNKPVGRKLKEINKKGES